MRHSPRPTGLLLMSVLLYRQGSSQALEVSHVCRLRNIYSSKDCRIHITVRNNTVEILQCITLVTERSAFMDEKNKTKVPSTDWKQTSFSNTLRLVCKFRKRFKNSAYSAIELFEAEQRKT